MIDCLIIGAGPIGLACGIAAKQTGLSHLIIDKGTLVNSIYHYPANMTFFSTSERLEIGAVPFISHNPKPTRAEALEYYRRVALSWALRINLYEEVNTVTKLATGFQVSTSKNSYHTKSIVVATGFFDLPYLLNISGETLSKVHHYYREAHPYFGMKIAVIGAANSAVDVALETYRKGAKEVTMIIRENEIGANVKYWVLPDILNRIKEGSIKAHFESTVTSITENYLTIKTPNGVLTLDNDFVLATTGYQPNFKLLDDLGIEIGKDADNTPIYDSETMETNVPGIFLTGVICGGLKTNKWFIENSRNHASLIINKLKKELP
ncbi:MAG: YpdA family putative bacillithiol disulfide reductase [Flammeovirgaceae bacterium]|nr:YpdA family putative bacillithiol disulfide reductase [Flammeovirgaceae bacterium]